MENPIIVISSFFYYENLMSNGMSFEAFIVIIEKKKKIDISRSPYLTFIS